MGLVMSLAGVVMAICSTTLPESIKMVGDNLYLIPLCMFYVIALFFGLLGAKHLDASIVSPLENIDGAIAAIILYVFFLFTDKTLPEEEQMKILNILTRHYDSYSQFHSINSHKSGDITMIDIHLSFEKNTTFEEILALKTKMQEEFDSQFGNCLVNIVVEYN